MIRALQVKAKSKNDPEFLKHKLGELINEIKKYKKEKEKQNQEVSELRDTINELRKKNKEMKEELKKVREEVRRSSEERTAHRRGKEREEPSQRVENENIKRKKYLPKDLSVESRSRSPSVVVMRPALGGRSMPILEGLKQKKEERLEIINQQIEALTKTRTKIHRTEGIQEEEEVQAERR